MVVMVRFLELAKWGYDLMRNYKAYFWSGERYYEFFISDKVREEVGSN